MCGIAGIIYKNGNGAHRIGRDMTSMLQSMKHRGPDSTGYALYHQPTSEFVVRINLSDSSGPRDLDFADDVRRRRREVLTRIKGAGAAAKVLSLGHSLEIVKDLGGAQSVAGAYDLNGYLGSHGIGHVRMAT